jgi:hypothetical protein
MTAVQLQELPLRVAAHNANKGFLIVDPHWDKVTVSNTEIINSNLLAVAQVLAPSLQLAACLSRIAPHNAAANNAVRSQRVDLWYKGATENTEIINSNLIALGRVIAPDMQLTAVDNNIAQYHTPTPNLSADFLLRFDTQIRYSRQASQGIHREPGKQLWEKFTTANTEVINANIHALVLAKAAAAQDQWVASCNATEGLWIKSAAENSEIINGNVIAFASALSQLVVQVMPPLPDQPPPACCATM